MAARRRRRIMTMRMMTTRIATNAPAAQPMMIGFIEIEPLLGPMIAPAEVLVAPVVVDPVVVDPVPDVPSPPP